MNPRTAAALAAAGALAVGLITGCSSGTSPGAGAPTPHSPPASGAALASAEAAVSACTSSGGTWEGNSCQAAAPQQTDPNGQQCPALDSAGYCPGDDPSPMQQWCNGTGYSDFQQVEQDLQQLQQDSGNNQAGTVEAQDGPALFRDAAAAVSAGLPPLSNAHKVDYGVWLGYLSVAGEKISQGDIAGASSALQQATQFTSIITYVSSQCAGTS
jgi:hypothetical protein